MAHDEADLESDLIDLTEVDLEQLDVLPDSVFAMVLLRVLRDDSPQSDRYTGFQSAI